MNKHVLRLVLRNFTNNSTLHGVCYLNEKEKKFRISWSLLIILSTILIVLTTFLNMSKYLKYENYFIKEETDINQYKSLPSVVLCESNEIELLNSLLKVKEVFNVTSKTNLEVTVANGSKMSFEKFKNILELRSKFLISSCQISKNGFVLLDCTKNTEAILTLYGQCWLVDFEKAEFSKTQLKKNDKSLISYFEKSTFRINFKIKSNNNRTFFKILSTQRDLREINSNYIEFRQLFLVNDNVLQSNFKSFSVKPIFIEYSTSLHGKYCVETNYQYLCHHECLKKLIYEFCRCEFSTEILTNSSHTDKYCQVNQFACIEEIIKNYESYRLKSTKTCPSTCLPSCKSLEYEVTEIQTGNQDQVLTNFQELVLIFQYSSINKTYLLKFDFSQMLNFSNGLLSLIFGMSILSLIEIIELIYILARCALRKNFFSRNYQRSFEFYKPIISVYKFLELVFHDTYMHGFKYIFNHHNARSKKMRWTFYLIIISIVFILVTKDEIDEYFKYQSDYIASSNENPNYLDRKFAILACIPIYPKSRTVYKFFSKNANDFFMNASNFSQIKRQYENLFFTRLALNKTTISTSENISNIYNQIFHEINVTLKMNTLLKYERIDNYPVSFDKTCTLFKFNQTYYNWAYDDETDHSFIFYGTNIVDKSKILKEDIRIFLMDSESLYIGEKSHYNIQENSVTIRGSLKYQKLIGGKFKPFCNKLKEYSVHECYRVCLSKLITQEFGCKIWYYGENFDNQVESYCHPFMLPLILSYEKFVLRNSKNHLCENCVQPCEMHYYELEVGASASPYIDHLFMGKSVKIIEQIQVRKFEETLFILISFIGLFYGGSLLSLVQIIVNLFSSIKLKNSKKFMKKLHLFDLLSNSTTLHCIKYISEKVAFNDFERLFWIIAIFLALISCFLYSIIEFFKFKNSTENIKLEEFSIDSVKLPKVDICFENNPLNSLPNETNNRRAILAIASSLTFFAHQLDYSVEKENFNLKMKIERLFKNYTSHINFLKKGYEEDWKNIMETKYSNEMEKFLNLDLFNISLSKGYHQTNRNFTQFIHQTGFIYDEAFMVFQVCSSVNLSILLKGIKKNPFTNLESNTIEVDFGRFYPRSQIYIENVLLKPKDLKLGSLLGGLYMNIKSFIKNFNYKYFCEDKNKCIYDKKMLNNFTDFELFYCNNQLKDIVYKTFNCTPFISNNSSLPECSFLMIPLLNFIFSNFKQTLFKCERVEEKTPIQFDETSLGEKWSNRIIVDFNDVTMYKQYVAEGYELLKLVINTSNFFSLFIGFSYLTVCEVLFIIITNCKSQRKIHTTTLNNNHYQ